MLWIVGSVYEQNRLWNNVHVHDWTAELAIIDSDELLLIISYLKYILVQRQKISNLILPCTVRQ